MAKKSAEDRWTDLLTNYHRSFLAWLPSPPRCSDCGVPFEGVGGAVAHAMGYRLVGGQVPRMIRGGAYSDPKKVRELLDASEKQEVRRRAAELKSVERRLAEVEADFAKNLALLKRDVLDEAEFRTANEARRDERTRLTGRQTELTAWLEHQRERQEAVGTLPTRVRSFLKDVQELDTRRAKALLQTILSAAHVYRDGRIELEFRGQHT